MKKFINPFPPLGEARVWGEDYIAHVAEGVPDLEWEQLNGVKKVFLPSVPTCSGIYIFVWHHSQGQLIPFKAGLHSIVYVGKAENLKTRISNYIEDKKAVLAFRVSKRKVRDPIRVMFEEYREDLQLYFSKIEPTKIAHYEDVLIKIFDPIFNTAQKLQASTFEEGEKYISASFDSSEEGFVEKEDEHIIQSISTSKNIDNHNSKELASSFGAPEAAF